MISNGLGQKFIKYVLIGFVNFGISSGLLVLLCKLTHTFDGKMMYVFSAISFTAASTNSYFCNRFWTFRGHRTNNVSYPLFYTLTAIGWGVASTIVYAVTTYIKPQFGFTPPQWVFVASVVSVGFSMVWNFTAYSQVVFRSQVPEIAE